MEAAIGAIVTSWDGELDFSCARDDKREQGTQTQKAPSMVVWQRATSTHVFPHKLIDDSTH
tara:strand:- start:12514 stop:12696 length:183 start_codon:yes stop_codon:yes gene_type:complete